ncbi:TPA: hypothetical protein M4Q54_003461 [Salmonella enterica subsp. enterica serovar Choleraesuis]|nr:hypothetical protein [Salmonella enterica subsp. enterica serovar Choleraesuis]
MGSCWSGTVVFNSLIRQTMGNAGRVAWHLTPLIARPWGSWSLSVAFNPLNRQTMEASWSCPVAFNPLNRQAMGKLVGYRGI